VLTDEDSFEAATAQSRCQFGTKVSALYSEAPGAAALLVLPHGAGAGMTHKFMVAMADLLAEAGMSTLGFHFP